VALSTCDELVASQKGETSQAVIKALAGNGFPATGVMTCCAIIAQTTTMNILVTRGAIVKLQAGEFHKRRS
jgi:hypothetical protein